MRTKRLKRPLGTVEDVAGGEIIKMGAFDLFGQH